MKKLIYSWGLMLVAAFTLTNCAQELDNPVGPGTEGSPFKIIASTTHSKTVNDGMDTNWSEEDAMNVFHAVGETTEYVNDGEFKLVDINDGLFEGTLGAILDSQEEYDWFAFYPYSSYIKTPANTNSGYMVVGSKSNDVQTQTGNNSMAHIAGENYPLAGFATAVSPSKTPKLEVSHVSSLIAVNVTNSTDEPLVVDEIVFTAPVEVVGTYYINFTDKITPASFEGSGANYVSKSASLKVNNGAEIAAGASAKFYLAVKPFTVSADDLLTIKVNKCVKEHKLANIVTFSAGKIKTLNFDYDYVASAEPEQPEQPAGEKTVTISFASTAQRTTFSISEQIWENEGVVFTNSKGSSTNNLGDYSNPARFYKNSNISITAPGNITKVEFNSSTGEYLTNLQNSLTGDSTNGNSVVMELDGSSNSVTYTLSGGQVRLNSLTVTYVIADPTAPSITAGNVTDISARGVESATLTYEIANLEYDDLNVSCDGTVVTYASKEEGGVINYTVSTNSTTSAREGVITITAGTLTKEVKVSQLAPKFTVARNDVELGATKDSKTTVTVTSDFDWTLSSEGTGYTVTPDSYTWDEDGKETVAIQATASRTEEGVAELGTITLVNSTTGQKLTIKVTQATSYVSQESETVTMNIYANKGTLSGKSISWTQNGFTVTNNQASSSNAIRTSDSDHFRLYAKSELIFTSSSKNFNKVVVTCTSSSYADALKTSASNAGLTANVSGSVVTISTLNPTTAMPPITMSAQSRINKVVVELN